MEKKTKRFAVGTMVALGVGYVAGILTAPKSGKETRKDLQKAAAKAKAEAEKQLKLLHSELSDLIAKTTKLTISAKTQVQAEVKKALETATAAQQKARDILSAVHEGDADDKELQKAVKEAKLAVEHLKNFLAKHA